MVCSIVNLKCTSNVGMGGLGKKVKQSILLESQIVVAGNNYFSYNTNRYIKKIKKESNGSYAHL